MVSRSVWLQRVGVAREPRGASGLTRARACSVIARIPPRLDHSVKCKAAIDRIAIWSNILDQGEDVASAMSMAKLDMARSRVTTREQSGSDRPNMLLPIRPCLGMRIVGLDLNRF